MNKDQIEKLKLKVTELSQQETSAASIQASILLDSLNLFEEGQLTVDEMKMITQDLIELEELTDMVDDKEVINDLIRVAVLINTVL